MDKPNYAHEFLIALKIDDVTAAMLIDEFGVDAVEEAASKAVIQSADFIGNDPLWLFLMATAAASESGLGSCVLSRPESSPIQPHEPYELPSQE